MIRPIFCRAVACLCVAATLPLLVAERELLACRWRRRACPPVCVAPVQPAFPPTVAAPPVVEKPWSLSELKPLSLPDRAAFPGGELVFMADSPLADVSRLSVAERKFARGNRKLVHYRDPLTFSPNGRFVGFGTDKAFWLADLKSGQSFSGGELPFNRYFKLAAMAIAPDGSTAALAAGDEALRWDVAKGVRTTSLTYPPVVQILLYSPDGKALLCGYGSSETPSLEGGVEFRKAKGGERFDIFGTQTAARALAFSSDMQTLAIGGADGRIRVRTFPTLEERCSMSVDGAVSALAFSPNGKRLAVGDTHGRVRRFDAHSGKELPMQQGHQGTVTSLAFADDSRILSADNTGRIILWDASRGDQLQDWTFTTLTSAITVAPDGRHVAGLHDLGKLVVVRVLK